MIIEHLEINPENFINNDQDSPPLLQIALHLTDTARKISHTVDRTLQVDLTPFILRVAVS